MDEKWMNFFVCNVLTNTGLANLNAATGMEISLVCAPCPGLIEAEDSLTRRSVLIAFDDGESKDATFGRMMTYAGATEAKAFVWIAGHAFPPHVVSCEWLNEHSAGMEFYLLEVWFKDMNPVFEVKVKP